MGMSLLLKHKPPSLTASWRQRLLTVLSADSSRWGRAVSLRRWNGDCWLLIMATWEVHKGIFITLDWIKIGVSYLHSWSHKTQTYTQGRKCVSPRSERRGSKIIPVSMSLLGKDEIKDWLIYYQYLISEIGMELLQLIQHYLYGIPFLVVLHLNLTLFFIVYIHAHSRGHGAWLACLLCVQSSERAILLHRRCSHQRAKG